MMGADDLFSLDMKFVCIICGIFFFLLAHIPLFLYPFLHTTSKTRPFEYLRLTSLGVVGALVKVGLQNNINITIILQIY